MLGKSMWNNCSFASPWIPLSYKASKLLRKNLKCFSNCIIILYRYSRTRVGNYQSNWSWEENHTTHQQSRLASESVFMCKQFSSFLFHRPQWQASLGYHYSPSAAHEIMGGRPTGLPASFATMLSLSLPNRLWAGWGWGPPLMDLLPCSI